MLDLLGRDNRLYSITLYVALVLLIMFGLD